MRWKRNLVQLEGEMVDSAMEEKLGTTGRKEMVDKAMGEKLGTTGRKEMVDKAMGEKLGTTGRDGGLCDRRETHVTMQVKRK